MINYLLTALLGNAVSLQSSGHKGCCDFELFGNPAGGGGRFVER